jgi:hypothetical protein
MSGIADAIRHRNGNMLRQIAEDVPVEKGFVLRYLADLFESNDQSTVVSKEPNAEGLRVA